MKFFKNLFNKPKNYTIHEIGGGDDDAYITFVIDKVRYMLLLEWEDGGDVMDISFGVEDEYEYDTTNHNKPYTIVNTVYDIVKDVIKLLENKHGYKFTKVSFCSSNLRNGEHEDKSRELRDRFFIRRILKNYPNATIDDDQLECLIIKLNNI